MDADNIAPNQEVHYLINENDRVKENEDYEIIWESNSARKSG